MPAIRNQALELSKEYKSLQIEGAPASASGYFSKETMEIGFSWLDDSIMQSIERSLAAASEGAQHISMEELLSIPEGENILQHLQVSAHETFHFFQSLYQSSVTNHLYWFRDTESDKFWIFASHASTSGKWDSGPDAAIYDAQENLGDTSFKSNLEQKQVSQKPSRDSILSFTRKIAPCNLSLLDLVESSAYIFQFVSTHSISLFERYRPSKGIYIDAFDYFLSKSDRFANEESAKIFLFITSTALHFGRVENYDGDLSDSPQAVFEYLCSRSSEYEIQISYFPTRDLSAYRSMLGADSSANTRKKSLVEKHEDLLGESDGLHGKESTLNPPSREYISQLPEDTSSRISANLDVLSVIVTDATKYLNSISAHHGSRPVSHRGKLGESFFDYISSQPLHNDLYIYAYVVEDFELLLTYTTKILESTADDDFHVETYGGRTVPFFVHKSILNCLSDFEKLITTGETYCCNEHQFTRSRKTLFSCSHGGSLNERVKMFGDHIELSKLLGTSS